LDDALAEAEARFVVTLQGIFKKARRDFPSAICPGQKVPRLELITLLHLEYILRTVPETPGFEWSKIEAAMRDEELRAEARRKREEAEKAAAKRNQVAAQATAAADKMKTIDSQAGAAAPLTGSPPAAAAAAVAAATERTTADNSPDLDPVAIDSAFTSTPVLSGERPPSLGAAPPPSGMCRKRGGWERSWSRGKNSSQLTLPVTLLSTASQTMSCRAPPA
jgi:hypothetical protein